MPSAHHMWSHSPRSCSSASSACSEPIRCCVGPGPGRGPHAKFGRLAMPLACACVSERLITFAVVCLLVLWAAPLSVWNWN